MKCFRCNNKFSGEVIGKLSLGRKYIRLSFIGCLCFTAFFNIHNRVIIRLSELQENAEMSACLKC